MTTTGSVARARPNYRLDQAKFDALVHYICARCENPSELGATKLNKILWYCDTGAYVTLRRPMTGATYIKQEHGPVPRGVMGARQRLVASGAIIERDALYFGYPQKHFFALRRPDISMFSADEISLVDQVIEIICKKHTAASISALTHNNVWEAAELGEEIPLYTIFASRPGELDENDIAWGRAEMFRLEPQREVV